jgi:tetratricopeptide (TPR) repeat protein
VADGLLANPKAAGGQQQWAALYVKGRLHAVKGELDPAVRALEAADEILPNLGVLQLQVTWLASAALYDEALQFVERGRRDPRWRPWQRALYAGFFDSWEREVRETARRKGVALQG